MSATVSTFAAIPIPGLTAPNGSITTEFCHFIFGLDRSCKLGDQCKYSHDAAAREAHLEMKECKKCGTFCRGILCKSCTLAYFNDQ